MTIPASASSIGRALTGVAGDTRFEDLPAEVVHEAKRYLVDTIGCAFGGHAVDKGRIALAHALRLGGPAQAGLIGHRSAVSAPAAAFANAELANALDHDLLPHVAPMAVAVMLAAAQSNGAGGRDLIVALVVAHEISRRLSRARSSMIKSLRETGSTPDAFGIENEATIGCALGAARLAGLSGERMGHALGLGAYFTVLPVARDWEEASPKSMVKYTPVGLAAHSAVQAAWLAEAGLTGNPDVMDMPYGFARYNDSGRWEPQVVTQGLGSDWTPFLDLQYKPWPCCRFLHSQLDALRELMDTHGLAAADIESIEARGMPFVANRHPYDVRNAVDAQFSLPFCMALVAYGVPADARWQSQESLHDARFHSFARRVRSHADPRAAHHKELNPKSWWSQIDIILQDGRRLQIEREHAAGTNGTVHALDDATLEHKFRGHAHAIIPADRCEELLSALWSLEQLRDTRDLSRLMAP